MAKSFKIELKQDKYIERCWECDKEIKLNTHFAIYGYGNYHLSCFHAYGAKLFRRWNLFKKNIQEHLNRLEPYQKEMICESLEKG